MSDNNNNNNVYNDEKNNNESSLISSSMSFTNPLPQPPSPPPITSYTIDNIVARMIELENMVKQQNQTIQTQSLQINELEEERDNNIPSDPQSYSHSLLTPKLTKNEKYLRRRSGVFEAYPHTSEMTPRSTNQNTSSTPQNNIISNHNNTNHNNNNNFSNNNNNSNNTSGYNRHFKPIVPEKFKGNADTTPTKVLSFISAVDTYIASGNCKGEDPLSLNITAPLLVDEALMWYEFEKMNAAPGTLVNWNQLSDALKNRFIPASQQQISMAEFMKVRYTGRIQNLISEMYKHLRISPIHEEKIKITVFINAIKNSGLPGSLQLTNQLTEGVAEAKLITFKEVSDRALLLESITIKSSNHTGKYMAPAKRPFFKPYTPAAQNNMRVYQKPRFNNVQNRQSKLRLNNIENNENEAGNDDNNDDDENQEDNNDRDGGGENNENNNDEDRDDDRDEGSNEENDNEEAEEVYTYTEKDLAIALNAVDLYKKYENKFTPDEIQKFKKQQKCYKCGKLGHYANECRSAPSSQQSLFMKKKSTSSSTPYPKRK
jgi:hypothetical protein